MQDELIILVAGAIFGFLSALLVELIKSRIEKKSFKIRASHRITRGERKKSARVFIIYTRQENCSCMANFDKN